MNAVAVFRRTWVIFASWLLFLSAEKDIAAADVEWLEPVRKAYERLDSKFHNFSVTGRMFSAEERVGKPAGKKELLREFTFSRIGSHVKTVRKQGTTQQQLYAAANDRYFFLIQDNESPNSQSLIDLRERSIFTLANVSKHATLRMICEDAKSALEFFGFPLEPPFSVLQNNAGHLQSSQIEREGRPLLLLEGDFVRFTDTTGLESHVASALIMTNSRILLDPALDYRVVEWESNRLHNGTEYVTREVYEYGNRVDGLPLLSKVHMRTGTKNVGFLTLETDLYEWRFNANEPEEFYLSHFGMKEPDLSKSFISGWLQLLLVGAALIIAAIWLRRKMPGNAA